MLGVRVLVAASFMLVLSGCGMTETMAVPKVETSEVANVDVPMHSQATFALSKVIAGIRRGTPIAHFPSGGVDNTDGYLCNYRHGGDSTIEWTAGSSVLGNWSTELGEVFHETLSQKGLNIAGDPKSLFKREESVSSAEYLVGARITEIRGNFCEAHHWWDGRPLGKFSGEMYLAVEWTIFSTVTQREVLKLKTEGYHKQTKSNRNGIISTFHSAFASATENILASEEFREISSGQYLAATPVASEPTIRIPTIALRKTPIDRDLEDIFPSVVTLRVGVGHGSGFVIARDGLIITNQHVVGKAKRVAVILSNGLELEGQVLRTNEGRDVALVKVPLRVPSALAVRQDAAKPLERVFAIGTPARESMRSTVTSGIVSAVRKNKRTGLRFIQADAAVSPGNSGGPLLDQNGNVLGVSVAKLTGRGTESLNLFIPITDALNALNVSSGPPES